MSFFAKDDTVATERHLFVGTKKFEQNGYARCGYRIYRIVNVSKDGVPVLRLFGNVKPYGSRANKQYEFKFATLPKGRYAKDINGEKTMDNYTPCKRGQWWLGATALNLKLK